MRQTLEIIGELIACASIFAIPFVLPIVLEVLL
jgi:hypothetical protein